MAVNYELKHFSGDQALAASVAADLLSLLAKLPNPSVALSGGRIAKTFFETLTDAPRKQAADPAQTSANRLGAVHFFWADERCVPPNDPDSNFRLAAENLFRPLRIAPDKIHRLRGELPPAQAVALANEEIRAVLGSGNSLPVLDVVILGLGEDGHTASLMPNAPPEVLESQEAFVHVPNSPKPPPNRITLTFPMLAAARNVWMLANGAAKAPALKESLRPGGNTSFGRVLRSRSQTKIYTDLNETN